jgi:hypothetical protein
MNHLDILNTIEKHDLNNFSLNCIFYKLFYKYKNNLITNNEEKIRKMERE